MAEFPDNEKSMSELLPFNQWSDDPFQRGYQVENALGRAFMSNLEMQMQFIKRECAAIAPALTETELEAVAKAAALLGLNAFLMVLDGVATSPIDAQHGIKWVLQARIEKYGDVTKHVDVPLKSGGSVTLSSFRPAGTHCVETIEVIPKGGGLCYAYHIWKEADVNHNQP